MAANRRAEAPNQTGLWQGPNKKDTLALALRLHPATKKVFVIDGKLNNDGAIEREVRAQTKEFQDRVEFTYLRDLTMDELTARVKVIPDESIILYTRQTKAGPATSLPARDALSQISQVSHVPIYGSTDQQIGYGLVGGFVFDTESLAIQTAKIALRVANGARPEDIPPETAASAPIFDWRQLRRWNISEDQLPPAAIVRFKQLSFWELYRWRIIAAGALLVLETLLIAVLMVQRSKRARAEKARRISEGNLQKLSGRLIQLQDEEQRRIAAELHDGLGQSLSIICNRATLGKEDISNRESVLEQLEEIKATAASAIDEVREIAHNLRPFELDRLGLVAAVDSMLEKVSEATSLRLLSDLDHIDGLLSRSAETSVYRIIQEGLNNVIKHAQATEARVGLKQEGSEIVLCVKDNGKGIAPKANSGNGNNGGGFGLQGIAERARMLGAAYSLESDHISGTTLTVRVTLNGDSDGK